MKDAGKPMMNDIKTIISLQLGVSGVSAEDRILEDLEAESADVVGIIAAQEDKFQIIIDEEEIPRVTTVQDLCQLVQAKVASSIKDK